MGEERDTGVAETVGERATGRHSVESHPVGDLLVVEESRVGSAEVSVEGT